MHEAGGRKIHDDRKGAQFREYREAYEEGWSEGYAEAHPEEVKTLEAITEMVDLRELEIIFKEYLVKSGVSSKKINIVDVRKTLLRESDRAGASYDAFTNRLTMGATSPLFKRIHDVRLRTGAIPRGLHMYATLLLVHELCHAYGFVRSSAKKDGKRGVGVTNEVGYSGTRYRSKDSSLRKVKLFGKMLEGFNEGVTQRIAEEVAIAYAKRVGTPEMVTFVAKFAIRRVRSRWQYSFFMNQVSALCDRVDSETGVLPGDTWKSVVRGYFNKPEVFKSRETLNEYFGPRFMADLSALDNSSSLQTLGKFDGTYGIPHVDMYAHRRLQELGVGHTLLRKKK